MHLFSGSRPCKETTIGLEDGRILDHQISSNSSMPEFEAHRARLNHNSAWCTHPHPRCYLQVNLNATHLVCAIATQGNASNSRPAFVGEYKVEFSIDGTKWDFYRGTVGIQVCSIKLRLCLHGTPTIPNRTGTDQLLFTRDMYPFEPNGPGRLLFAQQTRTVPYRTVPYCTLLCCIVFTF